MKRITKPIYQLMATPLRFLALAGFCAFGLPASPPSLSVPHVALERVPEGGIQPQTIVDQNGTVHLIYFKGDPSEGDLFYARSKDGFKFSDPIRVNSVTGTAVAVGNIRGARIAVGRRGRVYVAWNGSRKIADPAQGRSPMLFTRLDDTGTAFESERNLIRTAYGIDGGGGIAADQQGRVYVFWHAPIPGHQGEDSRRVWMARSEDDGKTFEPERSVWDQPTGACGCCSLSAFADASGRLDVLFRSAQRVVHRDMYLLESKDHGQRFSGADVSQWNVGACVMSSEAFASGPKGTVAAWETEKKVHFGFVHSDPAKMTDSVVTSEGKNQKYPSLAINRNGFVLVSWTEGMSWKRGGSLRWQLLDSAGRGLGNAGGADGVPAWSLVSAYPQKNGNFIVLY
jgi:hypothetical protein